MAERKFTDEEVAAIFKQAFEAESTAVTSAGSGMTLSSLQEIGREAGLSPEAIARAALALDQTTVPKPQTLLGLPVAVGQTVEVPRQFTEADWQRLVADLRTTFNARGVMRQDGQFREWRNGNLQALVEPTPTGFRLRLKTMNQNARMLMTMGLASIGISAASAIGVAFGGGSPGAPGGVLMLGIIGLGALAAGGLRLPGWARRRQEQMREISSRVASTPQITSGIPD